MQTGGLSQQNISCSITSCTRVSQLCFLLSWEQQLLQHLSPLLCIANFPPETKKVWFHNLGEQQQGSFDLCCDCKCTTHKAVGSLRKLAGEIISHTTYRSATYPVEQVELRRVYRSVNTEADVEDALQKSRLEGKRYHLGQSNIALSPKVFENVIELSHERKTGVRPVKKDHWVQVRCCV